MTDKLDKPTPPAQPRLSSCGLVLPPNCREVPGVPMAFIGVGIVGATAAKATKPG